MSELYYALSANVQRVYSKKHLKDVHSPRPQHSNMSRDEIRSIGSLSRSEKGRVILPPSIGHGEGSAGHRTASSCEALPRIFGLPFCNLDVSIHLHGSRFENRRPRGTSKAEIEFVSCSAAEISQVPQALSGQQNAVATN